jgi:hypothetical protein
MPNRVPADPSLARPIMTSHGQYDGSIFERVGMTIVVPRTEHTGPFQVRTISN